jgi:hypothetical protein
MGHRQRMLLWISLRAQEGSVTYGFDSYVQSGNLSVSWHRAEPRPMSNPRSPTLWSVDLRSSILPFTFTVTTAGRWEPIPDISLIRMSDRRIDFRDQAPKLH